MPPGQDTLLLTRPHSLSSSSQRQHTSHHHHPLHPGQPLPDRQGSKQLRQSAERAEELFEVSVIWNGVFSQNRSVQLSASCELLTWRLTGSINSGWVVSDVQLNINLAIVKLSCFEREYIYHRTNNAFPRYDDQLGISKQRIVFQEHISYSRLYNNWFLKSNIYTSATEQAVKLK